MKFIRKSYRIFYQKKKWKPSKNISNSYADALKAKKWFENKGIKCYIKRIK